MRLVSPGVEAVPTGSPSLSIPQGEGNGGKFREIEAKVRAEESNKGAKVGETRDIAQEFAADMNRLHTALVNGKTLSPQELMVYQLKASQFQLRVELMSKLGESMMQTFRKFQQGQ